MLGIGVALPLGVIVFVHGDTARGPAGLNIPSRAYWMDPSLIAAVGAIGGWGVGWYRMLRPPDGG